VRPTAALALYRATVSSIPLYGEYCAAPGAYFLGIQPKVSGSWLGIETLQLVVQGANEGAADVRQSGRRGRW